MTAVCHSLKWDCRIVATLGFLGLFGFHGLSSAADSSNAAPQKPIAMSRNSVLEGHPLNIGDLSPVSDNEAERLGRRSSNDPSMLQKCVESAPNWVRWSDDARSIELRPPWTSVGTDEVLAAYCDSDIVLLGGSRQSGAGDQIKRMAWVFLWKSRAGKEYGPVKVTPSKVFAVGTWPHQTSYVLNEVRAVDPVSQRILFRGTSTEGKEAMLVAPFYFVPAANE